MQSLVRNDVEISHEKERVSKLLKEVENENHQITRMQYELEVECKASSMARAWAMGAAERAREEADALDEARERWEVVALILLIMIFRPNARVAWLNAGKQISVEGIVGRAENLVDKLKIMADDVRGKSNERIDNIILKILSWITSLRELISNASTQAIELKDISISKAKESAQELQQSTAEIRLAINKGRNKEGSRKSEGRS